MCSAKIFSHADYTDNSLQKVMAMRIVADNERTFLEYVQLNENIQSTTLQKIEPPPRQAQQSHKKPTPSFGSFWALPAVPLLPRVSLFSAEVVASERVKPRM